MVIVDGGSGDGTWELLTDWSTRVSKLKVYRVPGANNPQGRNEAIKRTKADIIVTFDSGTQYSSDWLALMLKPFEEQTISVVSGLTICHGETFFEKCVAAFGDLKRASFWPSHRGIAFRREVWETVGGYPEHVSAGEDTWFDSQFAKLGYKHVNVPDAKNYWKVRSNWQALFKMQKRNIKGHVSLSESIGIIGPIVTLVVHVILVICAIAGIFDRRLWFAGAAMYMFYVLARLLLRGRWRIFTNPLKFLVGFYALTAYDCGTLLGIIEGAPVLLQQIMRGRKDKKL